MPGDGALGSRQLSFREILGQNSGEGASGATPEERARTVAEQLVATALIQPMLKEWRAGERTAAPFAPTQGEKQMRALQDAEVARSIVQASRFPIVDQLARRVLEREGGRAAPNQAEPAAGSDRP
jgi:hypothetical protein